MEWATVNPAMPNINEAKVQLSELLQRAAAGEEVIITKSGVPIAKLVPFSESSEPRKPGAWRGQVEVASGFDAAVPELLEEFEQGT